MPDHPSSIVARARFILTVVPEAGAPERIEDGYVLAESGALTEVGEWSDAAAARIIPRVESGEVRVLGEASGGVAERAAASGADPVPCLPGILLPGFIKAHGHDYESPLIGVARDEPLTDWLDHAANPFSGFVHDHCRELEKALGVDPYLAIFRKARLDDVTFGITSSVVHHCNFSKYHVDQAVRANREAGTRIFLAIGSQDRHYNSGILDGVDEAVARLDRCLETHGGEPRFAVMPGPDQFFSNGPEMLRALKDWARRHGTLIHVHSSEEPRTTEWFRKTYGMTPVEYGRSIEFLDDRTMLAHQVNCTPRDLKIIAETGTMVVHNPLANTILGSGMPPVMEMRKLGVPLAVSTDGSGSADNQNMIAAARLASQFQKAFHRDATALPAAELLELITAAPARMLGLDAGALRPGCDADFILLDTRGANMTPTRRDNCLENVFWAASGSEIRYVVAGGRVLLDDYAYAPMDAKGILAPIQELSERFTAWLPDAPEIRAAGARADEKGKQGGRSDGKAST